MSFLVTQSETVTLILRDYLSGASGPLTPSDVTQQAALKSLLRQHKIEQVDLPLIEQFKQELDNRIHTSTAEALQVAELTHALAQLSEDKIAHALGTRARAQALHVLSRYAEATELYQQAQQLYLQAECEVEAARVGRALVDALMYQGRYEQALKVADQARQALLRHDQPLLLAQLETNVGNIHHRLDQNHQALECYERAAEFFSAQNPAMLARVRCNQANVYCNLDDFRHAQTLYQQSYELHQQNEAPLLAAQVRYSLGYLHFLRGAYHEALRTLHELLSEFARLGDEEMEGLCQLDLAEIYLHLNVLDEADRMAAKARERFQSLEMRYEAAKAITFLGLARLRQGRFTEAENCFSQAREEFAAEGNEIYSALPGLYLAEAALLQQQPENALRLASQAEMIFEREKLRTRLCSAQLVRARALLDLREAEVARQLGENVLTACHELEAPWTEAQAHDLLGDISLAANEAELAYHHYAHAVTIIEQMRGGIRVDEFRSAFFRDKLRVYEKLIRLCLEQTDPEKKAEAFFYLESSKARTLVDLLVNELEVNPGSGTKLPAELQQRWQQLREELHWYYSRASQPDSTGKRHSAATDLRLRQAIHLREQALAEVAREAQIHDPDFVRLQNVSGLTVSELRAALAADEAVIEYYFDGDDLKIFVIDHDQFQIVDSAFSRQEIHDQILQLRFQLEKFHYGREYVTTHRRSMLTGINVCLQELYQSLFAPVAALVEHRKLIFIPFEILHNVPFSALYDGEKYLLDQHEIASLPGARLLTLTARRASATQTHALIFGAADEIAPQITAEIQAIRELFPDAHCFAGNEAHSRALAEEVSASHLIHIASHAVFRQDNPMFSAFKLADRWLNFYDVCALKIPGSLVTLSGCSTGANRIHAGDEILGLVRGFLTAGASSLVVSLWAVNDPATAALMAAFYRRLQSGHSSRTALREAALEIREAHEHPYYWAPFIYIGGAQTRVN